MTPPQRFDLLVIGGGLTGLAMACAAAGEGLRVLVVERSSLADTVAPPFDGRVTAIAPGSRRLLEAIRVWQALAADAQPILDIEVGERDSPLGVHYDHRQVGDEPLGHIVENRLIRMALHRPRPSLRRLHAGHGGTGPGRHGSIGAVRRSASGSRAA